MTFGVLRRALYTPFCLSTGNETGIILTEPCVERRDLKVKATRYPGEIRGIYLTDAGFAGDITRFADMLVSRV